MACCFCDDKTVLDVRENGEYKFYNADGSDHLSVPFKARYVSEPDDDQVRWGSNADPREAGLIVGNEYTVTRIEVHSSHTKLHIQDVPGRGFNSVSFEDPPCARNTSQPTPV